MTRNSFIAARDLGLARRASRAIALLVGILLVMQLLPASASAEAMATVTQDVTAEDPAYNGNLAVSSVEAFSASGGTAVFRPDTEFEEEFTYTGVDAESLILTGVRRELPQAHPKGSTVAPVESSRQESPPPGGEAASPTPSPATDEGDAASAPSSGSPQEAAPDASSADVGSGDSTAAAIGEIPPVCEILGTCELDPGTIGCQGCDELVAQLVGLIETCELNDCIAPVNELVARICGSRGVLGCQTKVTEVLAGAIGEACPNGLTTCADPTINMISRLVMDVVCPSGSIGYCAGQISQQGNEQVAFVVGVARGLVVTACTGDTANHCISKIQALLDAWVFQTVCGSSNPFTCTNNLGDKVNDLVTNACNLEKSATSPTYDSATTTCVNKVYETVELVLGVVDDGMIIACQSTDASVCARNVIEKVNETVSTACSFVPGTGVAPGATRCIDRVLQLVDTVVGIAQQEIADTCGSTDPRRCVEMATGEAFKALDTINDVMANTCNQQVGAQTSTTASAATACVDRVLATVAAVQQLVAQKMVEACGSSDPNACTANLLMKINVEINRTCASIPGDRNATGVNECIDKAVQIVNTGVEAGRQKMRETCGSDNPTVCANNIVNQLLFLIDRVNDTVANTCNQQIGAQTSTTDSAATACVNRVLATVAAVQQLVAQKMVEACGSSDPNTCSANLMVRINVEVNRVCASIPGDRNTTGVDECIEKALQLVETVMTTACRSSDALACATNLLDDIDRAVGLVCGLIPVTSGGPVPGGYPGVGTCVAKTIGALNLALQTACRSTDAATCADNVRRDLDALADKINDLIANSCESKVGVTAPTTDSAATNCVALVLQTVNTILTTACRSSDALACATNLLDDIDRAVGMVCGFIPVTSGGAVPGGYPGAGTCVTKTIGALNLAMTTACRSTDANTCTNNIRNDLVALADTINDAAANLCESKAGVTMPTSDSAVTNCQTLLLEAVNTIMNTACRSADPLTCSNNLLNDVDDAVGVVCGLAPVPTGGTGAVPGDYPGAGTCVLKALGTVAHLMNEICTADDISACVANLLDEVRDAAAQLCYVDTVGAGSAGAVEGCVLAAVQMVLDQIPETCDGSTDAAVCSLDELLERLPGGPPGGLPCLQCPPPSPTDGPVRFTLDVQSPALTGGRWIISTTDSPDSVTTEVLGTGDVTPDGVIALGVDLANRVVLEDDQSSLIQAVVTKPSGVPGFGLLAVSNISLRKSDVVNGATFEMRPPNIHLARVYDSAREAWEQTQCLACPVDAVPDVRPEVYELLPEDFEAEVHGEDVPLLPEGEAQTSGGDASGAPAPELPPENLTPPTEECTASDACGTPGPHMGGGYAQADCQPRWGGLDCITDYYYDYGVRSFRGWSHRVAGSTSQFIHGSSSTQSMDIGWRTDVGPFEYNGAKDVSETSSETIEYPLRGDCWNRGDPRHDERPCRKDGIVAMYGVDTNRWEKHLVSQCQPGPYGLCNETTWVYEQTVPWSMDGGTIVGPNIGTDGYYMQPKAIKEDYFGKWRPFVPGTKDTYALDEASRWETSFRIKVDYPQSFGSGEFVGSTWDETVNQTANKMHLRDLPWMRTYFRYDNGRGGPEFDTEWWSCQFKKGRTGGPCWQYPDF